ncbi:MAG: glycosyltransferase [Bacteroidales bacterium]|nr:glycosyltransferase [Bacteroidales bacterium]
MQLSVIIVNYNVKHFIEQCLHSVQQAAKSIDHEVFVVDNNSVDGSCSLIRQKFPEVVLIENENNQGFSKANNQAIKQATGKYVLLLNPDTVVEEDTFIKCIQFMETHPDAGSIGVKMIDGKGNFLPESKRSLPTPFVAFSKIFGLSKLFPKSKVFGRYHLGFLDKDETHKVDVLSGAFMFIRREALDKSGLLDEDFFMYGEDIDLSYRIIKAGYSNYYFPKTTIIHYKGESTKKSSVNYVFVFYNAMIIFARKHFSKKNAKTFSFLINMAIYFRASLSILKRFLHNSFLPLIDIIAMYSGFLLLIPLYAKYKYEISSAYPMQFVYIIVPIYLFVWLTSLYIAGGYEKPLKLTNTLKGSLAGTVLALVIYALLPETLRYSRAITILGSCWVILILPAVRIFFHVSGLKSFEIEGSKKKKIVIIGESAEAKRVLDLIRQTQIKHEVLGFVSINKLDTHGDYLGHIAQLNEIIQIHKVDELVFCAKDIPAQEIIRNMLQLSQTNIEYKIAPPESISIIGSSSIHTAGELYIINFDAITKPIKKRSKRLLDIILAILLLLLSPILMFFMKRPLGLISNSLKVLLGYYTWVGFLITNSNQPANLPKIRKGILTPLDIFSRTVDQKEIIDRANINYAKNYTINSDFEIIIKNFRNLGRKS